MRNQTVIVTRGQLKGYKGTVLTANEIEAQVHVHSKSYKVILPIEDLFIVYNDMEGVHIQQNNNVPVYLSFDEAANQEYVNAQDQDGGQAAGFGARINENVNKDFGDQTPVGSLLGADEVNEEQI